MSVKNLNPKDVNLIFTPIQDWEIPFSGGHAFPNVWKHGIRGVDHFLFMIVKLINRFAIKIFQIFSLNPNKYDLFANAFTPTINSLMVLLNPITLIIIVFGVNITKSFLSSLGSHTGYPFKSFIQELGSTMGVIALIIIVCSDPLGVVMWGMRFSYKVVQAFGYGTEWGSANGNPVVSSLMQSFLVETWTANFHGTILGTGCEDLYSKALAAKNSYGDGGIVDHTANSLAACFRGNGFMDAAKYMDGGVTCCLDLFLSWAAAVVFAWFISLYSLRIFMSSLRWVVSVLVLAWVLVNQSWKRKKFSEVGSNIIACFSNLVASILYSLFIMIGNVIIIELSYGVGAIADKDGSFPEIVQVVMLVFYALGLLVGRVVDRKILEIVDSLSKGSTVGKVNNYLPLQPIKALRESPITSTILKKTPFGSALRAAKLGSKFVRDKLIRRKAKQEEESPGGVETSNANSRNVDDNNPRVIKVPSVVLPAFRVLSAGLNTVANSSEKRMLAIESGLPPQRQLGTGNSKSGGPKDSGKPNSGGGGGGIIPSSAKEVSRKIIGPAKTGSTSTTSTVPLRGANGNTGDNVTKKDDTRKKRGVRRRNISATRLGNAKTELRKAKVFDAMKTPENVAASRVSRLKTMSNDTSGNTPLFSFTKNIVDNPVNTFTKIDSAARVDFVRNHRISFFEQEATGIPRVRKTLNNTPTMKLDKNHIFNAHGASRNVVENKSFATVDLDARDKRMQRMITANKEI